MIRQKSKFIQFLPVIIFVVFILSIYGPYLFTSQVIGAFYPDTDVDYYLKIREYAFGQPELMPKWNVNTMCGVPFVAEIQSGYFYPLNWIFYLVPVHLGINLTIFMHVFLLGLFTYLFGLRMDLSREAAFLSGLVMSLSGHVVVGIYAGHLSNLMTITWMPLVVYGVDLIVEKQTIRRYAFFSIVLALQLLAGHAQYFYYSMALGTLYFLYRSFPEWKKESIKRAGLRYGGFAGAIGFGMMMALPQILPVTEMLSRSARSQLSYIDVALYSLPVENFLTLLAPTFFGDLTHVKYWGLYNLWEMCIYIGILPLLLLIYSFFVKNRPHKIFFMVIAAVALLTSLGYNTPLLKLFYQFVPGFSMFRGHSKAAIVFCFGAAILIGMGFDAYFISSRSQKKNKTIPWFIVLIVAFIMLIFSQLQGFSGLVEAIFDDFKNDLRPNIVMIQHLGADFLISAIPVAKKSAVKASIFLILSSLVLLTPFFIKAKWIKYVAICIAAVDLFLFATHFTQTVELSGRDLKPAVLSYLKRDKSVYRVAVLTSYGWKYGSTSDIQRLTGDYPYVLEKYSTFFNDINRNRSVATPKIDGTIRVISDRYNIVNLKYIVMDASTQFTFRGYEKVYDDNELAIYENTNVISRAHIYHEVKWVQHPHYALKQLSSADVFKGRVLILEGDPQHFNQVETEKDYIERPKKESVIIETYRPDYIKIKASMIKPGWIYLADSFYPGWQAKLNENKLLKIYQANYLCRAVYVPPGVNEIVFTYQPTNFKASIFMSICSVLIAFGFLLFNFFSDNQRTCQRNEQNQKKTKD